MQIHALVDKYYDHSVDFCKQGSIISFVFFAVFGFSVWCVAYVGMDDHWFLSLLGCGAVLLLAATAVFLLALTVVTVLASFAGWIFTFGWVFASLIVFEVIRIFPKVYDRIDGNIHHDRLDLLYIMVLIAPVVLLAVAFARNRNQEKALGRLRNIPLTSRYEWNQDDG